MTVMNFDLEDGLPKVSFTLKPDDAERFAAFLAECEQAKADAHRLRALVAGVRDSFNRECDDADAILRTLGFEPKNCRTEGGSLILRELLGAIEHRDVMTRRAARKAERERCAALCDSLAKVVTPDRRSVSEDLARAIREDQP
jgi:hypothetical protein